MIRKIVGATAALVLFAGGAANAESANATRQFTAQLKGASEVPPTTSNGSGQVSATLSPKTKTLNYTVTYSGLTGPATAAHFHGPAATGTNAPPVVTVKKLPSPMKGSAKLTDSQIADLQAGRWYFNVHTAAHPSGEIRGQLEEAKSTK